MEQMSQAKGRKRGARTRDPDAARGKILAAAVREFAAKGVAGASMDAIGREAGVAKGLAFHHFGSKEGLFVTAMESIYQRLRQWQDATALVELGPMEGMRRLVIDTFRGFRAMPEIVALMNEENLHQGRHVRQRPEIPQLYQPLMQTIERLVADGRASGVFHAQADPVLLYIALSGLSYFYCANRWTLEAAFAGPLFTPERLQRYETLIADMVIAYLQCPDAA
jgi:TetR/AcrR family transcriptional regulator